MLFNIGFKGKIKTLIVIILLIIIFFIFLKMSRKNNIGLFFFFFLILSFWDRREFYVRTYLIVLVVVVDFLSCFQVLRQFQGQYLLFLIGLCWKVLILCMPHLIKMLLLSTYLDLNPRSQKRHHISKDFKKKKNIEKQVLKNPTSHPNPLGVY